MYMYIRICACIQLHLQASSHRICYLSLSHTYTHTHTLSLSRSLPPLPRTTMAGAYSDSEERIGWLWFHPESTDASLRGQGVPWELCGEGQGNSGRQNTKGIYKWVFQGFLESFLSFTVISLYLLVLENKLQKDFWSNPKLLAMKAFVAV